MAAAMAQKAQLNFVHPEQSEIDPRVRSLLDKLATNLGLPGFTIQSGYRSPSYNKRVGGAKKSQHMRRDAVDVAYPSYVKTDEDRYAFARSLYQQGFTGIGIYDGWVHADLGPQRGWGQKGNSAYGDMADRITGTGKYGN
jgi:uncharacterized protein YcbK (DUF882 family)